MANAQPSLVSERPKEFKTVKTTSKTTRQINGKDMEFKVTTYATEEIKKKAPKEEK